MSTCVIQFADKEPYLTLLKRSATWHSHLAGRNGYRYMLSTNPMKGIHPYWVKAHLMLSAAEKGFDHIVWLDADAIWLYGELPKPATVFGLTYHDLRVFGEPHYNAGVMFLNNDHKLAVPRLKQWINTSDDDHKWHDQFALNKILNLDPDLVTRLPHKFNSVEYIPQYRSSNPCIVAWHGCKTQFIETFESYINMAVQSWLRQGDEF